jgi:hypothetical protein
MKVQWRVHITRLVRGATGHLTWCARARSTAKVRPCQERRIVGTLQSGRGHPAIPDWISNAQSCLILFPRGARAVYVGLRSPHLRPPLLRVPFLGFLALGGAPRRAPLGMLLRSLAGHEISTCASVFQLRCDGKRGGNQRRHGRLQGRSERQENNGSHEGRLQVSARLHAAEGRRRRLPQIPEENDCRN